MSKQGICFNTPDNVVLQVQRENGNEIVDFYAIDIITNDQTCVRLGYSELIQFRIWLNGQINTIEALQAARRNVSTLNRINDLSERA